MKKKVFLFLVVVASALSARAQDTLRGPHSGTLKRGGNYRIEAITCDDFLEIFMYDTAMAAVANGGTVGDVKFFNPDQTYTMVKLAYYNNNGFTVKPPTAGFFYFRVSLEINGQPVSVEFQNNAVMGYKKD